MEAWRLSWSGTRSLGSRNANHVSPDELWIPVHRLGFRGAGSGRRRHPVTLTAIYDCLKPCWPASSHCLRHRLEPARPHAVRQPLVGSRSDGASFPEDGRHFARHLILNEWQQDALYTGYSDDLHDEIAGDVARPLVKVNRERGWVCLNEVLTQALSSLSDLPTYRHRLPRHPLRLLTRANARRS